MVESEDYRDETEHRAAIMTGASSGIGLGITLALLAHGYRVVGNSRSISQTNELKASADLVLVDGDIGKRDTAVKVADGIRVNTISPGVVETPMHASDNHEFLKSLRPIHRLVQVSEIVDALL